MFFKVENVNKHRVEVFFKLLKNHIDNKGTRSIVEVGCGDGQLAKKIFDRYDIKTILIDIEDNRIINKDWKFHKLDCCKQFLPFDDESIDMLIATQVVEHMEDLTFFMNEAYRSLKKNGLLFISLPNFSNIQQRITFLRTGNVLRLGGKLNSGGHINFITPRFLTNWLHNKFDEIEINGDCMAFTGRLPYILSAINSDFRTKHLILPTVKSKLLSYNINMVLSKV